MDHKFASTSFFLTRDVREPHGLAFSDARQSLISAISASCVSTQLGWRCARTISQTKIGPAGLRPPARQSEH
jgi:hypothetical protein